MLSTTSRVASRIFGTGTTRFGVVPAVFGTSLPSSSVPLSLSKRSYHENIVEHYENPRNVGSLDKNELSVGTGLVGAPACGDVMKLQIKVDDDGNIVESKFKTFGCGSAIAASSVATEWVKGKNVDEVLSIKNSDIAAHLKLPPVKLHCSMLAEDAIKAAVKDWKAKQEQDSDNNEGQHAIKATA